MQISYGTSANRDQPGIPGKNPRMVLLLKTGFCGGFTTFSTFAYETGSMMEKGQTGLALLYVVLSAVLGVLAVFAGQLTVR